MKCRESLHRRKEEELLQLRIQHALLKKKLDEQKAVMNKALCMAMEGNRQTNS